MDTAAAFDCLSDSQRQLLEEFGRRGVRFIVFGGYAVRSYGHLRAVHDLDLVVDCAEGNLELIRRSLQALNAPRIAAKAHRDLPDAPDSVREQYRKDLEALNAEAINKGIQGLVDATNGVVPSGKDKVMPAWGGTDLWPRDFDRSYGALAHDAVSIKIGKVSGLVVSRANLIASKSQAIALGPEHREKLDQDKTDLEYLMHLDG